MGQCQGVTKKNQRCRINLPDRVSYCHHHKNQQNNCSSFNQTNHYKILNTQILKPSTNYQTGFIYIYTLSHMLEPKPKHVDWLKVQTLKDDWDPKKKILIKIGLTQGKVSQRISRWSQKCKFDITIIDPYNLPIPKTNSLSQLFSKLKINDPNKTFKYKYYDEKEKGFYCVRNLGMIERLIHQATWDKFNKGDVTCHGCTITLTDGTKKPGTHKEWFLVDRKELNSVYMRLEEIIGSNT